MSDNSPRLYVVNSLPKVGSTWTYFCTRHAFMAMGGRDVIEDSRLYGLKVNEWGNPGSLGIDQVQRLIATGHAYVIKSHNPYRPELRAFLENGLIKAISIIRHPFDIVASALDYGKLHREQDYRESHYYGLHTIDDALAFLEMHWSDALSWFPKADFSPAKIVRYEEMASHPTDYLISIFDYFWPGQDVQEWAQESIAANKPNNESRGKLRFNKGEIFRYRNYFSNEDLRLLSLKLGALCSAWDYEIC
jgi:hypothetical protein